LSYARAPGPRGCAGSQVSTASVPATPPEPEGRLRSVHGMWRSLVSAPALGAGGRRFESGHPDHRYRPRARYLVLRALLKIIWLALNAAAP
jgi:hypothetical protein